MAERLPLPVRLTPRRRSQTFPLLFFGFFFGFSVFWIIGASLSDSPTFNDKPVTDPLFRRLFPLFGVPFLLIGLGGLSVAVLKRRPGSPYHHVTLSACRIGARTLFAEKTFDWHQLSAFAPLRVVGSGEDSSVYYYAVAKDARGNLAHPEEALRLSAREYGTGENEMSAAALADWLNQLRSLSRQGVLRDGELVDIPPDFRDRTLSVPTVQPAAPVERAATVVRR